MSIINVSRLIQQRGTKADCEAFDGALEEGALAYATDTSELGIYTNGAWVWIGSGGAVAVSDLTDVDLTGLADGDVLVYDSTSGDWLPETPAAGITVEEIDGTPSVSGVSTINITNGTLTDDGGGVITIDFGSAATDGNAIHDNEANEISAITEKTTPADDDILLIEDSAASYVKKKVKMSNLPGGSAFTYLSHFSIFGDEIDCNATLDIAYRAACIYGFYVSPSAANANDADEYTFDFYIAAGTYTITLLGMNVTTAGKCDTYIDNVLINSGMDWYGSTLENVFKTISSVVITEGFHTFKLKVNGKHASSTDYRLLLTKIWIK